METLPMSWERLQILIFKLADSKLDDIPELIDQDIDALIEQARLQRPDLMASEAQLKASLAKIEAVKADAKPKVED